MSTICFYSSAYKQPPTGANLRSELEAADGKQTQTESMTSNDVAVNTGTEHHAVVQFILFPELTRREIKMTLYPFAWCFKVIG